MSNRSCNFLIAVVDFIRHRTEAIALLPILFWMLAPGVNGANAQVISMELDTNVIALGDQTTLTIAASRNPMNGAGTFIWPDWKDTLSGGLEIIEAQYLDTVAMEFPNGDAGIQVIQKLVVTHWDSGFHAIAPIEVTWNEETLKSNPLSIQVLMPQPGKSGEIAGHAPLRLTSWSWKERMQQWLPWIILLLAMIGMGLWVRRKWKQREPFVPKEKPSPRIPLEPAHIIALRTLEGIQRDAIWKKGQVKSHHAAASEALRLYLEHRFDFPALERSTAEIKRGINQLPLRTHEIETLIQVLTFADLVKFAKLTPETADHQRIVSRSIRFVENTIPSKEANETEAP